MYVSAVRTPKIQHRHIMNSKIMRIYHTLKEE